MSRFNDVEIALVQRLRVLKAEPAKTMSLLDISDPLIVAGFEREEIRQVLSALEQDGILAIIPGARVRMLKALLD